MVALSHDIFFLFYPPHFYQIFVFLYKEKKINGL